MEKEIEEPYKTQIHLLKRKRFQRWQHKRGNHEVYCGEPFGENGVWNGKRISSHYPVDATCEHCLKKVSFGSTGR